MWGMHLGLAEAYDAFGQGRRSARMVLNHSKQALDNLPEQEQTTALRASLYLMMGVAEWRLMRRGRGEEHRRQRAIAHLRESLNLSRWDRGENHSNVSPTGQSVTDFRSSQPIFHGRE